MSVMSVLSFVIRNIYKSLFLFFFFFILISNDKGQNRQKGTQAFMLLN